MIADRLPPSIVGRRAATSDNDRKWANGYVFYTFGTRLIAARDRSFLFAIRDAMNKWEEQTCLRSLYRTVQTDYIEFTAAKLTNAPVPVGTIRVATLKLLATMAVSK